MLLLSCALAAPASHAVELILTARAATRAFSEASFKRDGKHDLIQPSTCDYTYLERPEVGFANDRVTIRLHFAARAGQEVAGQCVGPGEAFWLTISGTPYVDGAIVGVKDAHIVEIDNPSYRVLLEAALQGLVRGLRHDVGASVREAFAKDVNHYRLSVNNLAITNLRARDNLLRATIDFELTGDAAQ
jgi:hypothetical protein